MDNELTTLDAVEREIRARYNGKYQSAPEYQASERATRKAITDIFRAVAESGACDDITARNTAGRLLLTIYSIKTI